MSKTLLGTELQGTQEIEKIKSLDLRTDTKIDTTTKGTELLQPIKSISIKIGNREDTFVQQISEVLHYFGFYAENADECLECLMQICERVNEFEIKDAQIELGSTIGNKLGTVYGN